MQKRILDLFKLDGQVALVVGGNRGLGLSMARALPKRELPFQLQQEMKNK